MHKTAGATGNLRFPWRLLCHKGLSVFCHISLRFFFLLLSVISLVLPDLPCAAKDSGLPELRFDELYTGGPLGLSFTAKVKELAGKRVRFDARTRIPVPLLLVRRGLAGQYYRRVSEGKAALCAAQYRDHGHGRS